MDLLENNDVKVVITESFASTLNSQIKYKGLMYRLLI